MNEKHADYWRVCRHVLIALLLLDLLGVVFIARQVMLPQREGTVGSMRPIGLSGSEDVFFPSTDGVRLHGLFLQRQKQSASVVLCPGEGGMSTMLDQMQFISEIGYAALLLETRGRGQSAGEFTTGGALEERDVRAAVGWLANHPLTGNDVAVWGVSICALAAHTAAATSPAVTALISESAYPTLTSFVASWLDERLPLPTSLLAPQVGWFMGSWQSFEPGAVNALEATERFSPRPVLAVAAEDDQFVRPLIAQQIGDLGGPFSQVWIARGVGRGEIYARLGDEYRRRVRIFLAANLTPLTITGAK